MLWRRRTRGGIIGASYATAAADSCGARTLCVEIAAGSLLTLFPVRRRAASASEEVYLARGYMRFVFHAAGAAAELFADLSGRRFFRIDRNDDDDDGAAFYCGPDGGGVCLRKRPWYSGRGAVTRGIMTIV